jgi:TonB-linked SusC/RagA family outer membrane protein
MRKLFLSVIGFAALTATTAFAQDGARVSGRVVGETGAPLVGASVFIPGMSLGSTTADDGSYSFVVPASRANGQTATLTARILGYTPTSVQIALTSGANINQNFTLTANPLHLGEVVITGAGTSTTRERLTTTINSVDTALLKRAASPQNVVSALAGKAPNVEVRTQSGEPGASASIKIRGNASLTGTNQPLFVVDGQPIDNQTNSTDQGPNDFTGTGGTVTQNRAADINPNDIESIDILKGSAAAAIYGARAANGVILITTKRGRQGPTRMTFSSTETFDRVDPKDILQHSFGQGSALDANNDPLPGGIRPAVCGGPDCRLDRRSWGLPIAAGTPTYNHLTELFDTGLTADNNLSISGGNDRTTFYASGGLTAQNGYFVGPNNKYNRGSVRLKATHQINSKLNIGGNFNFIDTRGNYVQKGSNVSGLFLGALRTPPTFNNEDYLTAITNLQRPYRFPNPSSVESFIGPAYYDNPFFVLNSPGNRSEVGRSIANVNLDYNPTDWLRVQYTLGGDYYNDWRLEALPLTSANDPNGRVVRLDLNNLEIDHNLIATAKHDFTPNVQTSLSLGQNLNSRRFRDIYNAGESLIAPDPLSLNNTVSVQGTEFRSLRHIEAYFAQAETNLYDQLIVNLGIRNDGFSTFGASKRRNNFPKASAAWIFSRLLNGDENTGLLSFGKVRIAYGETGKEPPVYGAITALSSGSVFGSPGFGDAITSKFGNGGLVTGLTLGNPALRPERTRENEYGIDLGLFDQKVDFSATWYNKRANDVIVNTLPVNASETGASFTVANGASLTNKGVEFALNARPVTLANFAWDLGVQFARNRGKVTSLLGADNITYNNEGFTGAIGSSTLGFAPGVLRGSDFARCGNGAVVQDLNGNDVDVDAYCTANNAPRGALYLDSNGQPINDPTDRVIADPNPKYTMSYSTTVKLFNRITVGGLLDVRKGGDVWNGTRGILNYFGTSIESGQNRNRTDGTFGVNYATDKYPVVTGPGKGVVAFSNYAQWQQWYNGEGGGFGSTNANFVEDGSFAKLREISLGYTLNAGFLRSLGGFTSADIRLSGRNLKTWTKYRGLDPEANLGGAEYLTQGIDYFNNPQARSFVLSFSLNR